MSMFEGCYDTLLSTLATPTASSDHGFVSPKHAQEGPRGPAAGMAIVMEMAADKEMGLASATLDTRGHCAWTAWMATSAS